MNISQTPPDLEYFCKLNVKMEKQTPDVVKSVNNIENAIKFLIETKTIHIKTWKNFSKQDLLQIPESLFPFNYQSIDLIEQLK